MSLRVRLRPLVACGLFLCTLSLPAQTQPGSGPSLTAANEMPPAAVATSAPKVQDTAAALPATLSEIFGTSNTVKMLQSSLSPYLTHAAKDGPLLRPYAIAQSETGTRPEFRLGDDFIVLPSKPASDNLKITLPDGVWINYWTGAQAMGGDTVSMEVPGGSFPMWVRGGAVIQRRSAGYSNLGSYEKRLTDPTSGASMFEVIPAYSAEAPIATKDWNGRSFTRAATSLRVQGASTHAIIRWRFTHVRDVHVGNRLIQVQNSPDGAFASFEHLDDTIISWTVVGYVPHSY